MNDIPQNAGEAAAYANGLADARRAAEAKIERLRLLHENAKYWEAEYLIEVKRLRDEIKRLRAKAKAKP